MLKKTITFEDYEGRSITEDFYFNLTKAEVIKWLSTEGNYSLDQIMERMVRENNGREIMNTFENLIRISYGKKSLDGRRLMKSDDIWKDFYETEAYSELFVEIVTDAKKAADFLNAIMPKDLAKEIQKIIEENPDGIPESLKDYTSDLKKTE